MNLLFLILVFSALSTVLLYKAARGHSVRIESSQDIERLTKPVDLVAFRNLTDPAEEAMRQFFAGEQPQLGLHVFVPDFPAKAANLVRNLAEDRARLIQAVLTTAGAPPT